MPLVLQVTPWCITPFKGNNNILLNKCHAPQLGHSNILPCEWSGNVIRGATRVYLGDLSCGANYTSPVGCGTCCLGLGSILAQVTSSLSHTPNFRCQVPWPYWQFRCVDEITKLIVLILVADRAWSTLPSLVSGTTWLSIYLHRWQSTGSRSVQLTLEPKKNHLWVKRK